MLLVLSNLNLTNYNFKHIRFFFFIVFNFIKFNIENISYLLNRNGYMLSLTRHHCLLFADAYESAFRL